MTKAFCAAVATVMFNAGGVMLGVLIGWDGAPLWAAVVLSALIGAIVAMLTAIIFAEAVK